MIFMIDPRSTSSEWGCPGTAYTTDGSCATLAMHAVAAPSAATAFQHPASMAVAITVAASYVAASRSPSDSLSAVLNYCPMLTPCATTFAAYSDSWLAGGRVSY